MDFEVGSLADMISGSVTSKPHKKKVKTSTKIQFQKVEVSPQVTVKKTSKKRQSEVVGGSAPKRIKASNHLDNVNQTNPSLNISLDKKKKKQNIKKHPIKEEESEKISFLSEAEITEQESRTIFVGNLVNTTTKYNLKNWFKKFGKVDAIRLRGAPVADPSTSKRVAIIKSQFHPARSTFIAYVRFMDAESARKALAANGMVIKEHTIRVDMAYGADITNEKKAVFVGNVKFTVEEEDLRKVFESCGKIESIRLVRDKRTGLGKGIAFVNFESTQAVELALQLDGMELENRPIRVSRCSTSKKKPRTKKPRKAKVNGTVESADKSVKKENGLSKGKKNVDGTKVKKEKKPAISTEFQGQVIIDEKKNKMLKKKKKNKSELKTKKMMSNLHLIPKKIKSESSQ